MFMLVSLFLCKVHFSVITYLHTKKPHPELYLSGLTGQKYTNFEVRMLITHSIICAFFRIGNNKEVIGNPGLFFFLESYLAYFTMLKVDFGEYPTPHIMS